MPELRPGAYPEMFIDHYVTMRTVARDAIAGIPDDQGRPATLRDSRDLAAMAVGLYDMTSVEGTGAKRDQSVRTEVGQLGVLSQTFLHAADEAIDHPAYHRSPEDVRTFLSNCYQVFMQGGEVTPLNNLPPEQQAVAYGVGRHVGLQLSRLHAPTEVWAGIRETAQGLKAAAVEQQTAETPERLLRLSAGIGGGCTQLALHMGEAVDGKEHLLMRQVATAFGAGALILGHWSDVLNDLRAGPNVNTFATAFLRAKGQGVAAADLKELADLSQATADEQFETGKHMLGHWRAREIYRTMRWLVERKFALDRRYKTTRLRITPDAVRQALAAAARPTE
jgi:hypothetical protein